MNHTLINNLTFIAANNLDLLCGHGIRVTTVNVYFLLCLVSRCVYSSKLFVRGSKNMLCFNLLQIVIVVVGELFRFLE